jgi:hypothetical protein
MRKDGIDISELHRPQHQTSLEIHEKSEVLHDHPNQDKDMNPGEDILTDLILLFDVEPE